MFGCIATLAMTLLCLLRMIGGFYGVSSAYFAGAVMSAVIAVYSLHCIRRGKIEALSKLAYPLVLGGFIYGLTVLFFLDGGITGGVPIFFILAVVSTPCFLPLGEAVAMMILEIAAYILNALLSLQYPASVDPALASSEKAFVPVMITAGILGGLCMLYTYAYKHQQERLDSAISEAKSANEAKSSFLENMSHEIRTPMNSILGMNEMILREEDRPEIREYALVVQRSGRALLGIINDILDFSKLQDRKMEIVPVEYDVASILNDLVNMIKKRADDKNLELVVKVDPKIPHLLYGDEIRLKQVATNILTNAVKYTEKGSITLSVDITRIDGDDIILRYSVKDTGIGIKEEDLPKLFSAFERIEEKRNRSIEGTGLGMPITQHLLKMMGSELKVDSVYGEGSDFYFDITQKIIDAEPLGDYDTALKRSISVRKEYKESFTAPDAKILVVDDTEINLTVIKNLLKKTLVKIDTAQSGDECLMMMRQKKYDMVFLDHRMPGKDGIETLSEIKKDKTIDGDLPIIALTANAVSGSRDIYINAGFTDYLSKPIQTDILEGIICKFLPGDKVKKATISEQDDVGNDSLEIIPEIIRHSSLFDIKKAIANCGSSQGLMDALRSYYDSYQDNSRQIKDYYDSESVGNYTTKVHALKSSSRIVGLMELGNLAESLEKAGNEGDLSFIKKSTDKLLVMYREATALLAKIFEKAEDDSEKEVITPNKLKEAYTAMKEIAQMFDYDSILMVLDSIEKYKMPDDEKERFEDLKSAIRNADWDQIISILG